MSRLKELTWDEFVGNFNEKLLPRLVDQRNREGVEALVLFENLAFDSSSFGMRSALSVGPECTYKQVSDCEGKWLNDLPSKRQYPVAYTKERPDEHQTQ